jgi:transcriptional regulator with XRE-family HTH domain
VQNRLEQQLAEFLRKKRGKLTYQQFSRKLGLTQSSLFRLENGQQSITLRRLQQIMARMKCSLSDIFPNAVPAGARKRGTPATHEG